VIGIIDKVLVNCKKQLSKGTPFDSDLTLYEYYVLRKFSLYKYLEIHFTGVIFINIINIIDEHAVSGPDIVACCNYSNGTKQTLTYAQLRDMSGKLAFFLQDKLGEDKTPIVVYGHKSPLMLVCFLACVKSGRAYCPVDTSVPSERVKSILNETKSPIIFCTEEIGFDTDNICNTDDITQICQSTQNSIDSSHYLSGDDIFYIIFTSGSTGTPKGVQITAQSLLNFVDWAVTLGGKQIYTKPLTIINQAPFSFDLSVMDLYIALYTGSTLWTLEKNIQNNTGLLFQSLKASDADVWVSTPSFANVCLADQKFNKELLPEIKVFLFCGETLTNQTVKKLHERFPQALVVNTYGPTESTVAITEVLVTEEMNQSVMPLPVGRPKPGTYILIMNENGEILPEKERGEIIIAGDTVSSGYFNRKDLTEKSFFTHKIGSKEHRAYRTGDEGYMSEGLLYFCGRIDLQIKLNGYRIEIEDIENNLAKLSDVKSAVVLPVVKDGVVKAISAFIVPAFKVEDPFEAGQRIRKQLSNLVPVYMLPKKYIFIDSIPVTNNGKADRKALEGRMS